MFNRKRKRQRGQGLVEFAMVLPLLLLVLAGMVEFGRVFAIYSSLFNAAREGTRYGIVNPLDTTGILAATTEKVFLINPSEVTTQITFDSGPGTSTKDAIYVQVGDRVVISLHYDVEPILPLLAPLMDNLYVETVAARTIASMGDGSMAPPPTALPTPTTEITVTPDETPIPTTEVTVTPENTPSPTPDVPIQIAEPLREGDTAVSGTARPGETLTMRDIQSPEVYLSTTVDADGSFSFRLDQALVAGHVIVVTGYGKTDWAIVEGASTPTPSPTPSPSPTLTPTPGNLDIVLNPVCGPAGENTITVNGYNWPYKDVYIRHFFNGNETDVGFIRKQDFTTNFVTAVTIDASSEGTHYIKAYYKPSCCFVEGDVEPFQVPCAAPPTPTPTPTPAFPNLIVQHFGLVNSEPISTHDPLTFTVSVRNIGETAANNLFWVDLYVDPTQPLSPTNPLLEQSTDWGAVSSLEPNSSVTLTLHYLEGFEEMGTHSAFAMADTWGQVLESDELDNAAGPLTVNVSVEGTIPTPTPTPTPAPVENGTISGLTLLYVNGDYVTQGRVNVYCYDGDVLVAETLSAQDGTYELTAIAPGTYTVIGEAMIVGEGETGGTLYTGLVMDITVVSGEETPNVILVLHSS